MAANPIAGISNPFVANLNACVKTFGGVYTKVTACTSTDFTSATYEPTDTACAGKGVPTGNKVGTCINIDGLVVVQSYKVTCVSSANSLQSAVALFVAVVLVAFV